MDIKKLREYFQEELGWKKGYQSDIVFKFLCDAAKHAKNGVVLDAGCGHQRYKPFFYESIYIGQEHPVAGVQNKNITKYEILCDIKKIPLIDNSVSVILSTSALEHYSDPESFFQECFRVLEPGGSLWINVPFAYDEHEIPYDFQRPTRYGLIRWYEKYGFSNISVKPTSSSICAASYLIKYAVNEEITRMKKTNPSIGIYNELRESAYDFIELLKTLDRGPFPDTRLPIGWCSVGYKKGYAQKTKYSSPFDFLKQNHIHDGIACFENESLVYII